MQYSLIRLRNAQPRAAPAILEFGNLTSGATYVLRPGGYALIFGDEGGLAAVATPWD
jgi:hypothetical protein